MNIATMGIDLAKNVFQLHGVNSQGKVALRRQIHRSQMRGLFVNLPPCLIGMEACASAHYWARTLQSYGHTVRHRATVGLVIAPCAAGFCAGAHCAGLSDPRLVSRVLAW